VPLLRILVAEDDPHNRQVATRALEEAGAVVDVAPDGQTAVAMAARTRFDLILMDVQMPIVDGLRATLDIRAAERRASADSVPIIAFTAHGDADLRARCIDAGMNDYLVKPVAAAVLVDTVRKWADWRPVVLVADDAPEIRRLVRQGLRENCRVVEAVNGREALRQFDRQPIALVLLDMNMPVLDGYATAAAIRQRDAGRIVPIVALTGSEGLEDRERAAVAGCTIHLAKPFALAALRSTVKAALRPPAPPPATPVSTASTTAASVYLEIDPIVADLVPGYIREKRQQVLEMRRLIATRCHENLRRIAHDLKGTGAAYGMPDVTRIGRALEDAARDEHFLKASALVDELDALLARVQEQLEG
jgi:CheY-like chemotaxis protein/HPt (histidine-containing phosphotransfer) domain-containing protein